EDGLTLGVTTVLPQEIPEPFVTADDVPNSYCFGFDGKAVLPDSDDPIDTGWNPKDVRVGDRVGLLVTPRGEGQVFHNGEAKVTGVLGLPVGAPLFPIVDLLGSAVSVSLVPAAEPPIRDLGPSPPPTATQSLPGSIPTAPTGPKAAATPVPTVAPAPAPAPAPPKPAAPVVAAKPTAVAAAQAKEATPATRKGPCFSSHLKGRMVALSEQNTVASKQSGDTEALHSVVFLEWKMPAVPGGFYFEVRVEQTLTTELDG
ncbi:neurl4, partial [Symbiodinium sp. CCMP2456]